MKIKYFLTVALSMMFLCLMSTTSINAVGISGVDVGDSGKIEIAGSVSVTDDSGSSNWNKLLSKNRLWATVALGCGTIIMGCIWAIKIAQFSTSGNNPAKRSSAIRSLILLGVATALLGGTTFFVGLMTNLFKF